MHNKHILLSWPISLLSRRLSLCSNVRLKEDEKANQIVKFRAENFPLQVLQALEKVPLEPKARHKGGSRSGDTWLALPYHPLLTGVPRVLAAHRSRNILSEVWNEPEVKIAWCNSLLNVGSLVRVSNGVRLGLDGGFNKKT